VTGEPLSTRTERDGDTYRVVAVGELDIATVGMLERAVLDIEDSASLIVLDLSGLSFIDSTGLRLVIDLSERYGGATNRLQVIAGSPAVERLLDVAGLRGRLPLITP
jgi:anti-anti-sigma factor